MKDNIKPNARSRERSNVVSSDQKTSARPINPTTVSNTTLRRIGARRNMAPKTTFMTMIIWEFLHSLGENRYRLEFTI